jgi:hypothetical protein
LNLSSVDVSRLSRVEVYWSSQTPVILGSLALKYGATGRKAAR